jgi:hypothetical protein
MDTSDEQREVDEDTRQEWEDSMSIFNQEPPEPSGGFSEY